MNKNCIFNVNKICDNCGECLKCDLDKNKQCNNCGKCLKMDGIDIKAVKIDEIFENTKEKNSVIRFKKSQSKKIKFNYNNTKLNQHNVLLNEEENLNSSNKNENDSQLDCINKCFYEDLQGLQNSEESFDIMDKEDMWEYIDDIENLSDILNDETLSKEYLKEEFPGFVYFNSNNTIKNK